MSQTGMAAILQLSQTCFNSVVQFAQFCPFWIPIRFLTPNLTSGKNIIYYIYIWEPVDQQTMIFADELVYVSLNNDRFLFLNIRRVICILITMEYLFIFFRYTRVFMLIDEFNIIFQAINFAITTSFFFIHFIVIDFSSVLLLLDDIFLWRNVLLYNVIQAHN